MKITAILAVAIVLAACDPDAVYEKNYEMKDRTWYVDSIPVFQFDIPDMQKEYTVSLNIRNTRSYPFQNIYITYYLEDTTGTVIETDLVDLQLFDAKSGAPLGQGGLGDMYDHRFTILDDYMFSDTGTYNIRLQQYMRRDSLPEIIAVGIKVDENNKGN